MSRRPRAALLISFGQLTLDLRYGRPDAPQVPEPAAFVYVEDLDACKAYRGAERDYRERAATLSWLEREIDRPALAWPTPVCGTPMCLNLRHLEWTEPRSIDYPPGVCVYCGLLASTKDHLLPRTWTGETARRNVIVVPACHECNSVIGDRYAPAVDERRKIAQAKIRSRMRNKRLLAMPEWKPEEIRAMGRTMRSVIERGIHDRRVLVARLAWPEDPLYDFKAMQRSGIENPYAIGLLESSNGCAA